MPTRPVAVIIGMMGAGKTRVGKEVAQLMSMPFADADVEIEHEVGMRIPEYFERHGEPAFREVESEVIAGMLHGFGRRLRPGRRRPDDARSAGRSQGIHRGRRQGRVSHGRPARRPWNGPIAVAAGRCCRGTPMPAGRSCTASATRCTTRVANVHVETYGQTPLAAARKMMDMITRTNGSCDRRDHRGL